MPSIKDGADVDLDWFAVDAYGYVGYFTTAGSAPLPRGRLPSMASAQRSLLELFENPPEITRATPITDMVYLHPSQGPDDLIRGLELGGWMGLARRGLYGFDAQTQIRKPSPYIMVARPDTPMASANLPPDFQYLLAPLHLQWLRFAEPLVIPPQMIYREA
jgi:hypothetical protein